MPTPPKEIHSDQRDADLFCPLPPELDLSSARRVLVVAPHPDDETLGCGGTLALLSSRCALKAVLVTDGKGVGRLPGGAGLIRQQEFRDALAVLGVSDSECLGCPDGAFINSSVFQQRISEILLQFAPNWVFLPSPLDYHRDHVRISAAVEPLCRSCASLSRMLFYEIWAPLPATHVVDITAMVERKRQALRQHKISMAKGDYMRALDGLSRYRGLYLGRDRFAEAFWVEPVSSSDSLFSQVQTINQALRARLTRQEPP